MATVAADIREIRQTVYGRDMREPIVDALKHIRKKAIPELPIRDANTSEVEHMGMHQLIGAETIPMKTWYTYDYTDIEIRDTEKENEKTAEVVSNGISASVSSGDDYTAMDSISRDSAESISGEDYMWIIPNPVKETHTHYGDDWMLILTRREE